MAFYNLLEGIINKLNKTVRTEEQVLTVEQKSQARINIGAMSADAVSGIIDVLENKINKEDGKGLSTNDFTDVEKDKLAGIEEGAQINIQSDYAQNDFRAPDYIKNRLAWTSGGLETILDTTLNIEVRDADVQYAYLGVLHLVEGEEYIVSFDYDKYNCLCRIENIDGNNILALGNANLYDSDKPTTGEPFFVELYEGDGEIEGGLYTLSRGEIQFSIHKFIEIIHQIDEKYIPDTIARTENIPIITVEDIDEICGQTIYYSSEVDL